MIKVKIEDKEFVFAETWDEIYFNQYISIVKINKIKDINDIEKAVKIIAAISDKPKECEEELMKLHKEDFEDLATEFEWTNKPIEEVQSDKEFVLVDGKKYIIKKNYQKLTLGEMVSIENLMSFNPNLDPFEVVFGVLLREVDETTNKEKDFDPDDFMYMVNQMQTKVKLMDIYNYISFFLRGRKKSSKRIKGYSIVKMEKN